MNRNLESMFSVRDKVFLFTGGGGILASHIARALGIGGAKVVLTDIVPLDALVEEFRRGGIVVEGYGMNVLRRDNVEEVVSKVLEKFGRIDALLNAAGGNMKEATTSSEVSFFDLPIEALERVVDLNLFGGAIIPSQVVARYMVRQEEGGSIINFSSMAALRPLTRVVGYSVAKAAVSNFTQWLAVYLAREFTPKVRVNALAPGFFVTKQNYALLYREDGTLTPRGEAVLAHTPCGRFGVPEDLVSTVLWLLSPASSFVTGVVVPVDGGFSAFSGV